MKIAIIDDSKYKIEKISDVIKLLLPTADIYEARSFHSGKALILKNECSLWILDMTLPNYERSDGSLEGTMRTFGGRELLKEAEFYQISGKAIVVTQFDRFDDKDEHIEFSLLIKQLHQRFPTVFRGGVFYNSLESHWERKLRSLIKEALSLTP